jgi:hypothetical protein
MTGDGTAGMLMADDYCLLMSGAAPQRRVVLVPFEDVAEIPDPRRGQRLDRAR